MSNTIVMNLRNGAVTEHSEGPAYARTMAASALGLFAFNVGDLDDTEKIAATFKLPSTTLNADTKIAPRMAYVSVKGRGPYRLLVHERDGQTYPYAFSPHAKGRQRAVLGKGLRANYFDFEFQNISGAGFSIDKLDLVVPESKQRRL
jgi:hypothetical protein